MTKELTDEELLVATDEEWAFYKRVIEGLPSMAGKNNDGKDKFGEFIPYHSGPHILRHFMDTIHIVHPKRIFEIGFNMGHSSAMWLNMFPGKIVSCDVSKKDETLEGIELLRERYQDRFVFEWREDMDDDAIKAWVAQYYFDLAFIDGAHDEQSIINDIHFCVALRIPYLLFDDWYPRYGETQKAVEKFPNILQLVKDMNNLRLYKVNYDN